jgi:hypothetical protein
MHHRIEAAELAHEDDTVISLQLSVGQVEALAVGVRWSICLALTLISVACIEVPQRSALTEVVAVRVLAITADTFDEGAAVAGWMLGGGMSRSGGNGLLWGAGAGLAFANGCHVELEGLRGTLSAHDARCHALKVGELVEVRRDTTTYVYKDGRKEFYVSYRW